VLWTPKENRHSWKAGLVSQYDQDGQRPHFSGCKPPGFSLPKLCTAGLFPPLPSALLHSQKGLASAGTLSPGLDGFWAKGK
jgi:hypothetical protein